MSDKAQIIQGLADFVSRRAPKQPLVCTVDSVDTATKTCYCIPVNGDADIFGVRLIAQLASGFIIIPTVNSSVIVSFIDGENAYVSMFSQIDEIELNGVLYGGVPQVNPLVTKINNLENLVNDLISKFNTHTHILTLSSGTGTAAVTVLQETTVLTPTTVGEIENVTVKHGNGT